ncbi:MAG: CoA transferase [Ilumatobacter sp.]
MTPVDDVASIAALLPGGVATADHIELDSSPPGAASAFDVDRLLAETAVYSVAAIDALVSGGRPERRMIDAGHVLSCCTTHVEVDGEPVPAWADLSGVYATGDERYVQIHCNFPHHADGVVRMLGTTSDRASVASAIAERPVFELESDLVEAGLIGAAVRTLTEWEEHPHAVATGHLPLVSLERIGEAPPSPHRPIADLRVLDCSRVLAGPVAGQMIAGFGADVLRLGAAHLPSVPVGVISTGFGKRNAFADLRTTSGRVTMTELLSGADVWIDAFRPGAMSPHGFTAAHAASLRPGLVIVQVSAFDWVGPWAGRRGFDSIVQSTTGVRWAGGEHAVDAHGEPTGVGPTGLPVQALDYATGFLAAGVAAQLVQHQRDVGGSWLGRMSLLRTRNRLVAMSGPTSYVSEPARADPRHLDSVDSEFGRVTAVTPFAGRWHGSPALLGSSAARWRRPDDRVTSSSRCTASP